MTSAPTHPPTLLIVMGTSGSGKSTVGAALSKALSCPFVDGDDLHPTSNVDKMSRGQPLNDDDREPWLLKIRETGLKLATDPSAKTSSKGGVEEGEVKKLAEVYETSQQATTSVDHHAQLVNTESNTNTEDEIESSAGHIPASKNHLAIIACSSLKLIYRRLLRGTLTSLADKAALAPESASPVPQDLKVVHVYLDLSRELLEDRMKNRKGHFMKLDMLYSQLDTLQKPDAQSEMGVVVVDVQKERSTEVIVQDIVQQLKDKDVI